MTMEFNFRGECIIHHLKYGKMDDENFTVDQFVFSHPNYFLYHEDPAIGHLYEKYKDAFHVFEIINN